MNIDIPTAQVTQGATTIRRMVDDIRASVLEMQRALQQVLTAGTAVQENTRAMASVYAQAQANSLAYRKEQDTLRESVRQQATAQRQSNDEARRATYAEARAAALAYRQEQDALRESLRQQYGAHQQAAQGVTSLSGIVRTATGVLAAFGVSFSVQAIVAWGKSIIETGAKLEQLQRSLVAVTGGHKAANEATVQASTLANRLGLTTVTLTEAYRGFLASTRGTALEGEGARQVFEAVTVASQKLGSTNEQTGRAFLALQQIVSKGIVQQEELRGQLSEALPGATQIAARGYGLTTAELNKFIEKGGEGIEFVKKFSAQLIKEYGGGADIAATTATAAFARLENEWIGLKDRIARGGPLQFVTTVVSGVAGLLTPARLQDEAIRTRMTERAEAAARPTYIGTTVPGILGSAESKEIETLLEAETKLLALERQRIALPPSAPIFGFNLRQEAALLKEVEAVLAKIETRRQTAGRVQAGVEPGGDPSSEFYAQARALEQKAKERLDALDKELRGLQRETALLLQGQTGLRAKELGDAAQETRQKLIDKGLEETAGFLAQRPAGFGGIAPALQERFQAYGQGGTKPEERIRVLLTEGQTALAEITIDPFLSDLEKAQARLKAWQETIKEIRGELGKLSEPLRQEFLQSPTSGPVSPFRSLISPIAAERGVNPLLIEALIAQESGNNPRAVSPKGAKGLGQFMPGTAAQYGIAGREFDPEANIRATVNYLADLLKMFGQDVNKALTAYNAGPRNGGIPYATGENATFAQQVLARVPRGPGDLLTQATTQEATLKAAVEAQQPDQDRLAQIRATGTEYLRSLDEELQMQTKASESLQRLEDGYTKTKEARDQDTASQLRAQYVGKSDEASQRIVALAELVIQHAQEREAIEAKIPALQSAAAASKAYYESVTKSTLALRTYQEQLDLSGGEGARVTPEARAVTQARERLQDLPPELKGQGQQVLNRLEKAAQEATPAFRQLRSAVEGVADGVLDLVESAASGELFRGLGPSPQDASNRMRLRDIQREIVEERGKSIGAPTPEDREKGLRDVRRLEYAYAELNETIRQSAKEQETLFGRISESFSKMVLEVTIESLELKKVLADLFRGGAKAGADWLGTALGLATTIAGAAGGVGGGSAGGGSTGPGADFAQSGATLFDTGGSFRAAGGSVATGQTYWVGERGPEIMVPSLNGRILSHADAMSVAMSGSAEAGMPPRRAAGFSSEGVFSAPPRASGGPVSAGSEYVVGEHGPEPFIPAVNGRILSHADAMDAWSDQGEGSGEGSTIIQVGGIHVHGVQNAETFLRSQGQLNKAALQIFDQAQRSR